MDDATRDEALAWLSKARRDLDSAQRLLSGTPPFRDTSAYHCQPADDKALKAYLTACAIPYPKTHDLTALLALTPIVPDKMPSLQEAAIVLTPYATLFASPTR